LSDVDGEVVSINVMTGDIVYEYDILMQIKDINEQSSDYDDVDEMMNVMYDNYIDMDRQYSEFQMEYGEKIKNLENQLFNDQNALIQAMELDDQE
jgi:septation ring formation regulator EzrA